MREALRILIIEDSADDAALVERELRKGGYLPECLRVDTLEALYAALQRSDWDVVITDHNIPGFSSNETLAAVKQTGQDLPVIIVSGSIGEDIAVAAMKAGAHDYIMKGNLARLVPAIARERREMETRRAHRRAQETIQQLAFHDILTGLTNRYDFEHRLAKAVRSIREGARHALLFIDLDQFKIVNDTCGHAAGDELLRSLAVLLKEPIRTNDTLARLGGDEFAVLLENCDLDHALEVAERLLRITQEFRFVWRDKAFAIGASIGLVMIDDADRSLHDLMSAADMACYVAKDKGRNRVHVYSANDSDLMRHHGEMEWVSKIMQVLQDNRFELYRQIIIPLHHSAVQELRYEYLLRMQERDGSLVLPGAFIPAAERYNIMPAIDRWVVHQVFKYLSRAGGRHRHQAGEVHFINISGVTLSDNAFLNFVAEQLELHKIDPAMICFEITETTAIANFSGALLFVEKVKSLGCGVALDDFGAGLSSFSYMKTIPADYLKIDGSFIKDMLNDPMDAAIVEAINSIGHVAGLKTIAEFVESEAIKAKLVQLGVDYAQGYGIEHPGPCP